MRANRPNAPSTCTHAPAAWAIGINVRKSSNVPTFRSAAFRHTIFGPSHSARWRARSSARMSPMGLMATSVMDACPRPRWRIALSRERCLFSLVRMRIRGAPNKPSFSAFHPAFCNTPCRAAASAVTCAIWHPVVNAKEDVCGRSNSCFSHSPAISSIMLAAGATVNIPAFWSQADTSQSAASAEGSDPAITQPKNRPPALACRPGSACVARSSIMAAASRPVSGSGPDRAARRSRAVAVAPTGRSGRLSSQRRAWNVARSSGSVMANFPSVHLTGLCVAKEVRRRPFFVEASRGLPLHPEP